jgi:hypothetical protein
MISLTIADCSRMTKQDAAALRAIADAYYPTTRNQDMDVGTLKTAIARGMPGAMSTLAELNEAAHTAAIGQLKEMITPAPAGETVKVQDLAGIGSGPGIITTGSIPTDPARTFTPPPEAKASTIPSTGDALLDSAASLGQLFVASAQKTADRLGVDATAKLHPHDNPAAGAPDQHDIADQVFSGGGLPTSENVEPDPAALFSGGGLTATPGAAAQLVQLGAQVQAGITALGATVVATPAGGAHIMLDVDQAQPAPNVQSTTPIPPPLPTATAQTSQQQSDAVTNVSPPPPPPPALAQGNASAAVATTNPAPTVEVDATGLPWDPRIHASTKTKTAKNVWTRRRGVEDDVFNQVEAQLKAAMAIPAPPANVAVQQQQVATDAPPTFPTLMTFITERVSAQRLSQADVQAAVQSVGLESLNLVMSRADLIPGIMAKLREVAP